jgi:hypothetical protein
VLGKLNRGFESHPLRHSVLLLLHPGGDGSATACGSRVKRNRNQCRVGFSRFCPTNIRHARLMGLPAEVSALGTKAGIFHFLGVGTGGTLRRLLAVALAEESIHISKAAISLQQGVGRTANLVEEHQVARLLSVSGCEVDALVRWETQPRVRELNSTARCREIEPQESQYEPVQDY